jgi:hypothetical protein
MDFKKLLGLAGLISLTLSSVNAWSATVYAPTNQNVNFINADDLCYINGTGCPDAILGIFDDSDATYAGSYLAISLGLNGDVANFAEIIGQEIDYNLSNNSGLSPNNSILSGNDHFLIALRTPAATGGWAAPDVELCNDISESCRLSWDIGGSVLAIDLVAVGPPSEIPVPAAVWLFGSGLLGLVGIARRKKTT